MAYEMYNVRVQTLNGQDMGSARLYLGINHPLGACYYYSTVGIQDIQTQYRIDTGVTMDLNGLCAFSAQDPVNMPAAGPWSGMGLYLNHRFSLPPHTQALRYIFKNGSYIEIDPVVYRQSENDYYCLYRYYTKNGTLVIDGSLNCRTWNYSLDIARACSTRCLPWKGYSEGDYYRFVEPHVAGSTDPVGYSVTLSTNSTSKSLAEQFFTGLDPDDANDPYPDVPDSGDEFPEDPDGIPEPDPVPFPDDPIIDVTDVGFVTLYAPTKQELKSLAAYMWSSLFDIDTLRKLFADPMDCILGLNILPFHVPQNFPQYITVGNISTGVQMHVADSQWVTIDCGSIDIGKVYDTYLDYAPYTKTHIYLPFIGMQEINTDDVAHKVIHLKYKVDVLSCACIAFISADDKVLYQFAGTCGYSVPISSTSFAELFKSAIDVGVSTAMLVATSGAGAAGSASKSAVAAQERRVIAQRAELATSSANAVMSSKPTIKRSGSLGGGSGIMGVQKPYILFEIPRLCKPTRQSHFLGYPSFITIQVSGISGYAEFESIILNGVTCTEEERDMLSELFKGGIYV